MTSQLTETLSRTFTVSPEPLSVRATRRWLRQMLHRRRLTQLSERAEVLVGELGTNAIRHASTKASPMGGAMMHGRMPPERAPLLSPLGAVAVADQLRRELSQHGITADVNDGYGLAVVSIWRGLAVWTNGDLFWWCSGWNDRRDRPVYAWHPTADPTRAARRIAARYRDLRATDPAALGGS
ncbi:hypothetical protein [Nonomuraea sp. B19D2]|uniref:hypothetical protein n=1 Tax=Nonomuraea sp. B19D2 TaxID=3159561 RepID=UPI0032DA0F69